MKLSIIIPIYNEVESLDGLFEELSNLFADESATEIISKKLRDKLFILEEKIKNYSTWKIINLYRNYGKSVALHAGFAKAKGDVVITMDADLQDSPEDNSIN